MDNACCELVCTVETTDAVSGANRDGEVRI